MVLNLVEVELEHLGTSIKIINNLACSIFYKADTIITTNGLSTILDELRTILHKNTPNTPLESLLNKIGIDDIISSQKPFFYGSR